MEHNIFLLGPYTAANYGLDCKFSTTTVVASLFIWSDRSCLCGLWLQLMTVHET
jgi:hypothetical protein